MNKFKFIADEKLEIKKSKRKSMQRKHKQKKKVWKSARLFDIEKALKQVIEHNPFEKIHL